MPLRPFFPRGLACSLALLAANLNVHRAHFKRTLALSVVMLAQNLMFFAMWIVFFHSIPQLKGWHLQEVAIMYGIIASAVGLSLIAADGARTIALRIMDGSLDALITRPRHPLPALLFSRSNAASLGDFLAGPIFWLAFGGVRWSQLPFLLALTALSATIFLSATVIFYSAAFWMGKSGRFSDQLFETLIIFATIPQHSQPMGVKFVTFSLLPAGFITLFPATLLRHFDFMHLLVLMAAAAFYALLALAIFNRGLRRYIASA